MKTYTIEEIKAYMEGGLLMKSACLENRMLENLILEIDDSEDGIEYFTERTIRNHNRQNKENDD